MQDNVNVIGVIPARYESTRLPHKLTQVILGKPLLQWVWENASKARALDVLMIACDDPILEEMAKGFGANVVMTSAQHTSGTDRVAEAVSNIDAKVVINIQADEPILHPSIIDSLATGMLADPSLAISTVCKKIEDPQDIDNPNVVKVICDKFGFALYFSRFPIPYYRTPDTAKLFFKHLGIYAYAKDFLYTFKNMPPSRLELAEKLEQLRVLEAGYKIKVIETKFDSQGVDTEEDLKKAALLLSDKTSSKGTAGAA